MSMEDVLDSFWDDRLRESNSNPTPVDGQSKIGLTGSHPDAPSKISNRQARIKRLKEAFQKVEQLMNEGYVVQWDGDTVVGLRWDYGLELDHGDWCYTGIYADSGEFEDMADMKIAEINKELKERLTVWKKVEVKL